MEFLSIDNYHQSFYLTISTKLDSLFITRNSKFCRAAQFSPLQPFSWTAKSPKTCLVTKTHNPGPHHRTAVSQIVGRTWQTRPPSPWGPSSSCVARPVQLENGKKQNQHHIQVNVVKGISGHLQQAATMIN